MTTTLQELGNVLAKFDDPVDEIVAALNGAIFLRARHTKIRAALELLAKIEALDYALVPTDPNPKMIAAGSVFGMSPNATTIFFQSIVNAAQQKEHGDEVTSKLTGVGPLDTPVAGNYVGPPSPPNDAAPPAGGQDGQ